MSGDLLHKLGELISKSEIRGKTVLEAGSRNVNGSIRTVIEPLAPLSYIGVDIEAGDGVDQICNVYELVSEFGSDHFDVVLGSSILEHVEDWAFAVSNLKTVLSPGGLMIITVPGIGVKRHGYPNDFWRYEVEDLKRIFSDMEIEIMDMAGRHHIIKMRKPDDFRECGLSNMKLHSIIQNKRIQYVH